MPRARVGGAGGRRDLPARRCRRRARPTRDGTVRADVAPVALTRSLAARAHRGPVGGPVRGAGAPAPDPGVAAATPADPVVADAINAARATRQSTDANVQALALQALDCTATDPLRGYDDPRLPLVSCNQDGTEKYVLGPSFLEGTQIATAQASQNTQGAGWVIDVTFKSEGAAIWGDYTSKNVGKNVAFTLDGEVVSAPTINGPIFGNTQITGQFNQQAAQSLAGVLRYGSLPLSFESSEAQTVSATLGLASLRGRADRRRHRARARVRLLPVLLPGAGRAHDPVARAVRRSSSTPCWCCSAAGSASPWTSPASPGSSWPSASRPTPSSSSSNG